MVLAELNCATDPAAEWLPHASFHLRLLGGDVAADTWTVLYVLLHARSGESQSWSPFP